MLGLPGSDVHLEFTSHADGSPCPAPSADNLLVLYVESEQAAELVSGRLADLGYRMSSRRTRTGTDAASRSRIPTAGASCSTGGWRSRRSAGPSRCGVAASGGGSGQDSNRAARERVAQLVGGAAGAEAGHRREESERRDDPAENRAGRRPAGHVRGRGSAQEREARPCWRTAAGGCPRAAPRRVAAAALRSRRRMPGTSVARG